MKTIQNMFVLKSQTVEIYEKFDVWNQAPASLKLSSLHDCPIHS